MSNKITSSDYTDVGGTSYANTAPYGNISLFPNSYSVDEIQTDANGGEKEYGWQNTRWDEFLGYYKTISQTSAAIDKMALWTVGQGIKFSGGVIKRFLGGRKLGMGKDTLTSIFYNLDRVGQIAGDCFAEIIEDKQGRLINLKPLSPGTMKIISNKQGMIIRYEQTINGEKQSFNPQSIFHIQFNRIADEIHGISVYENLESSIKMKEEIKKDLQVVFHRYVKPLLISEVDTEDPTEIAEYKAKLDSAMTNGENMIIPKGVATVERVSIPQFSTLDPLPWIKSLSREMIVSQGVPQLILGSSSEEDTEASSKIVYLAYEQYIKFRQTFWKEQVKRQLGLELEFEFPASIAPELLKDNKKDSGQKPDKINPSKQSQ